MKLTEKELSPCHRVLVYGPPKTGKTQLVGALSQFKKLLWFDLENGYTTLLKFPQEWKERIEIISLPDTKTFPIAIETCLKVIKGGPCKICEIHGKVACPVCTRDNKPSVTVELNKLDSDTIVVFDSMTQLTASAIAHITKGKDDDYKMQTDDWGSLSKLMDIFLSHVQQAPYNIVCISHEVDTEKDEKAPERLVAVAGSRNTSKNTAKFFDHVVYASLKNKKHGFYSSTTSAMNFSAGSRLDITLEKDEKPSLALIFCPEQVPELVKPGAPTPATPTQSAVASSKLQDLLKGMKK